MKIQSVTSLIIIAGTALSMSALADPGSYGNGKSRFLGFFDTNGDNIVTMDEFNASATKRFEKMDADSNGSASNQEFQSYIGKKREQRREYKFQAMDGDKNGQVGYKWRWCGQ